MPPTEQVEGRVGGPFEALAGMDRDMRLDLIGRYGLDQVLGQRRPPTLADAQREARGMLGERPRGLLERLVGREMISTADEREYDVNAANLSMGLLKHGQSAYAQHEATEVARQQESRLRGQQLHETLKDIFARGLPFDVGIALLEEVTGQSVRPEIREELERRAALNEQDAKELLLNTLELSPADLFVVGDRLEQAQKLATGQAEEGRQAAEAEVKAGQAKGRERLAGMQKEPEVKAAIEAGAPLPAQDVGTARGKTAGGEKQTLAERAAAELDARKRKRKGPDRTLHTMAEEDLRDLAGIHRAEPKMSDRMSAAAALRAKRMGQPVPPPWDAYSEEELLSIVLSGFDPFTAGLADLLPKPGATPER
jgi:hypothetical protein